jgi:hypothetical protein
MVPDRPDESFKVTDRRRRPDAETVRPDPRSVVSPPTAGGDMTAEVGPARSLAELFVMFASSALIALGESPDPLSGQVEKNLAQASQAIDILTLLREKTEGNRSPEETRLLEQLIYDLQLRFVRATGPRSG